MSAATTVRNFDDGTLTFSDDGANTAVLQKVTGSYSVSNIQPGGREAVVTQAQGAVIGTRKGERALVTISITAHVARFDEDAYQILMGTIGGYTSTVADIGDDAYFDLQLDESYSANARVWTFDDCRGTMEYSQSAGESATVSIELQCIGPVVCDGVTMVPSR
jgi:hypothetical protein